MQAIPIGVSISFIAITVITVYQFYSATNKPKYFLAGMGSWMLIQLLIGSTNFYLEGYGMPPRFVLMLVVPLSGIILLFVTKAGRQFMDSTDIGQLTILHTIRIFVEVVLYFLFVAKAIPEIMTFDGRNFDIVAGLTAPVVYYVVFVKGKYSKGLLVAWNIGALLLLFNIITIAFFSLQTPVQRFGLDQPNIGLARFPFNWLPSVVVPIVLLSHFISLRQLLAGHKKR